MRALVTGGAGFIGSTLVRRLVESGDSVTVIDDLSTGRAENLRDVRGIRFVQQDLSAGDLTDVVRGVDVIFHLAAVPSVPRSVREPLRSHAAAATATLNLLVAARDAGVSRFVTSSSSSVYGDAARSPVDETMPTLPRSPYAVAKLAAEGYTSVFGTLFGMETVSLRYFNVFGPRQDPNSTYSAAIPRFITAYLRSEPPVVYGDGRQSRDFTYVDNVVDANLLAARATGLKGESVNIAAGAPRSVLDVLRSVAELTGRSVEPRFEDVRPGDIRNSHADIGKARQLLGFEPRIDFTEGLRRTVAWIRESSS